MLEYKSKVKGCTIIEINRFFPSSQLCSHCGEQNKELTLTERQWECKSCGKKLDRDENAARNILNYERYEKVRVPKELGKLTPMENPKNNYYEKWQLKGFEEVGKKVEKSTKLKAISSFE